MNAKLVEVFLDTQEKVKILNTKTITTKHNSSDILYPDFDEHTKPIISGYMYSLLSDAIRKDLESC